MTVLFNYQCSGTLSTETRISGAEVLTCDGGTWAVQEIQHKDIEQVFAEYLAPDPVVIGLVSSIALAMFVTGVGAGRVVQLFRKV